MSLLFFIFFTLGIKDPEGFGKPLGLEKRLIILILIIFVNYYYYFFAHQHKAAGVKTKQKQQQLLLLLLSFHLFQQMRKQNESDSEMEFNGRGQRDCSNRYALVAADELLQTEHEHLVQSCMHYYV